MTAAFTRGQWEVDSLRSSLVRVQESLAQDAKSIGDFIAALDEAKVEDLVGSNIAANVTRVLISTLNTSGHISAIESAIGSAARLAAIPEDAE
jgi:hypothetical protein